MTIRPIEGSGVAPEYQDLHELYELHGYFREMGEALLARVGPYLDNPRFSELLGRCTGVGNEIGALLLFLQREVIPRDPELLATWREACDAVNRGDVADRPRIVGA